VRRRLIPALIVLALIGLLIYQLAQTTVECKVCVTWKNFRKCATAAAKDESAAREEAHRSACSLMASGVSEAFACPNVEPDEVKCQAR
jgi:hypothetical protein